MKTRFPSWSRSHLEKVALKHAFDVSFDTGRDFDPTLSDRLVVNMLRHEFSDYDDNQSATNFSAACAEIAIRFLWLAPECERQMARRRENDAAADDAHEMFERATLEQQIRRRAISAASSEVIRSLRIGDRVTALVRGRQRSGTIVWVGRKQIEFSFKLKSGQVRTHKVYASEAETL